MAAETVKGDTVPVAAGADTKDPELLRKREMMFAKLNDNHKKREETREKRKAAGEEDGSGQTAEFLSKFEEMLRGVKTRLEGVVEEADQKDKEVDQNSMDNTVRETRKVTLDGFSKDIALLQDKVAAAAFFLPPYEIRQAHEAIGTIKAEVQAAREKLIPKAKFSFRRRKQRDAAGVKADKTDRDNANKQVSAAETQEQKKDSSADGLLGDIVAKMNQNVIKIENRTSETLAYRDGSIGGKDIALEGLTKCSVHVLDHVGAVRMNRLTDCTIIVGAVSGSVHLEGCTRCTFVIHSRQIRIHAAESCDFYLRVMSRPIIEHTNTARFAPSSLSYPSHAAQLQRAGLDSSAVNPWSDVDDFNWLRKQQSPHWSVLPESDRKLFRVE